METGGGLLEKLKVILEGGDGYLDVTIIFLTFHFGWVFLAVWGLLLF